MDDLQHKMGRFAVKVAVLTAPDTKTAQNILKQSQLFDKTGDVRDLAKANAIPKDSRLANYFMDIGKDAADTMDKSQRDYELSKAQTITRTKTVQHRRDELGMGQSDKLADAMKDARARSLERSTRPKDAQQKGTQQKTAPGGDGR
jgi:hypothetical protein